MTQDDSKMGDLNCKVKQNKYFYMISPQMMNNVDVSFLSHVLLKQSYHDKANFKKIAETENTFDQSFLLFRFSVPSNASSFED